MMKERIILFGAPAAGKGTLTQMLEKKCQLPNISTGKLLRETRNRDKVLGKTIHAYLSRGEFIPDSLIQPMIKEWLEKHHDAFLLDGFPRTLAQAEFLDTVLSDSFNTGLQAAIFLRAPYEVLFSRVALRADCEECSYIFSLPQEALDFESIALFLKENPVACPRCQSTRIHRRRDDSAEMFQVRHQTFEKKVLPLLPYYREKGYLLEVDVRIGKDRVFEKVIEFLS